MRGAVTIVMLLTLSLMGSERVYECTKIFEERKAELILELEKIDEKRQTYEAFKSASDELLDKKRQKLAQKEEKIASKLEEIKSREANVKAMLERNQKLLDEINSKKMDALAQTFSKMKAASAASILSSMQLSEAVKILAQQKPKTVGKILSKMDPKKASKISVALAKPHQ